MSLGFVQDCCFADLTFALLSFIIILNEYADSIGADKYASDAMETVRYAEEIWKAL